MKYSAILPVVTAALLLSGCAAERQSRARTAPAGPVSTGSTSQTMIPAGTTLVIRANESIEADSAVQGRRFSAEIAQDVVNQQGQVLIPRGSDASLVVLDASRGGAVGSSNLELALSNVTVNGRTHEVTTDIEAERGGEGLGANRRTATHVGGGAALGAIIGGIAGGGSGAAAGAAIGAAGGAAAQVLTRGDRIRVPAESVMTFRLEQPIRLR